MNWLTKQKFKDFLSHENQGYHSFKLMQDRNCVIGETDEGFMEIKFPPKEWLNPAKNGKQSFANYTLGVYLIEFDPQSKQWIRDEQMISVRIPGSSYEHLVKRVHPVVGDILGVHGKPFKNKLGFNTMGVQWRVVKRGQQTEGQASETAKPSHEKVQYEAPAPVVEDLVEDEDI